MPASSVRNAPANRIAGMASRGTGFLSALGFAIVGVAAAWLWLVIRPNEHSTDTASPASLAAPPAIVAPRETAPAEPSAPATTDAPRTARAPSLPTHPVGWEDSLRASTDYFALAQRAALSALAGDSRAQYVLGQVLSECRDQLRPVASMQSGSAAGNVRAYLALIPDAENRALVARRIGRCEKFFDGSPLDGLDVPEGAHDSRYWLDQAIASRTSSGRRADRRYFAGTRCAVQNQYRLLAGDGRAGPRARSSLARCRVRGGLRLLERKSRHRTGMYRTARLRCAFDLAGSDATRARRHAVR